VYEFFAYFFFNYIFPRFNPIFRTSISNFPASRKFLILDVQTPCMFAANFLIFYIDEKIFVNSNDDGCFE